MGKVRALPPPAPVFEGKRSGPYVPTTPLALPAPNDR